MADTNACRQTKPAKRVCFFIAVAFDAIAIGLSPCEFCGCMRLVYVVIRPAAQPVNAGDGGQLASGQVEVPSAPRA